MIIRNLLMGCLLCFGLSGCSATFKVGGGGGYCEDNAGIYLPHHVQ